VTAPRPALRPLKPPVEATLTHWLDTYISEPHADLGRTGPVCPYVPAAGRHNLVIRTERRWIPSETNARGAVTDLILDAVAEFQTRTWPIEHPELRAVVAAIPDMPRAHWPLLDEVQQTLKGRAVAAGLMLGPFHRDSRVPAAHNPAFHPNTAPVPLLVVRAMARHDLLFLHERPDWFRAYQRRFAHTFHNHTGTDPLTELYRATIERSDRPIARGPYRGGSPMNFGTPVDPTGLVTTRVRGAQPGPAAPEGIPKNGLTRPADPTHRAEERVQGAWRGMGHEVVMVVVLDPYPRWRSEQRGNSRPTLEGCELLAAQWTGTPDAPDAKRSLLQVLDHVASSPELDLSALVEAMPEEVDLVTFRASDILGPWPETPSTTLGRTS
jgi:hypothetical protein